ncbi:hypothetical protein OESDEN_05838 [Oesophagostomum dentatum]|uniref:Uncharacterized protein n=1 Tax=Oesophagostomum dentatum TaxID=61180 RepID=A0A0B1TDQ4_OESDE|nr:hypothetical protein OESDEN_05838 [Oesophagostomum dentatum]
MKEKEGMKGKGKAKRLGVDAAEKLKNKETVSITFDSVTRLDISNGVILNSCHRHPAMSERIKHRHNLFYNFKIAELKQGQVTKTNVPYFVRDRRPYEQHKFDIVYADAGGIIIKRCNIYEKECLYRYSIPQHAKEEGPIPFKSFCLYLDNSTTTTRLDIYPAIIFENLISPFKKVKSMDLQNQRGGMEDMVEKDQTPSTSHRPIQVLGFITFIYLCIFFFYAFKPHRTSNLVELSAMMEDELTRLSILTNEAVEKIRVTRAEKISPSLLLMKHPEDPTQESLEDVCCPGSTCDASLCINEHHLHEYWEH